MNHQTPIGYLLLAFIAFGCGSMDGGQIALQIHYTRPATPAPILAENAPEQGSPPPDINWFRLCVLAADMDKPRCSNINTNDYLSRGQAKVGGIPAGGNRRVVFQGYYYNETTSNSEVFWCGEVSGIRIRSGQTTPVSMFITACRNFTATRGAMQSSRVFHTATKLPDGKVLLAGGFQSIGARDDLCDGKGACHQLTATSSVEIYDPRRGEFGDAGFSLAYPRGLHTATLLPDGRVLVFGGCERAVWRVDFPNGPQPVIEVDPNGWGLAGSVAEIIDPQAQTTQELTPTIPWTPRAYHSAMPVSNGDVLFLGGMGPNNNQPLQSAVHYQSSSGEFIELPTVTGVERQAMTLVHFGEPYSPTALLWGGNRPPQPGPGTFAEIFNFVEGGPLVTVPRFVDDHPEKGVPAFYAAGAQIETRKVLVTGGMVIDHVVTKPEILNIYRLLDMQEGNETIAPENLANTMSFFAAFHTVNLLGRKNTNDTGFKALVAGGFTFSLSPSVPFLPQNKVVYYLPWEGEAKAFGVEQIKGQTVTLSLPRAGHTTTEIDDATILFVGGFTGRPDLSITPTAEIYNPTKRVLRGPEELMSE